MKTAPLPLAVARTQGARIVLADGRELVDGMASWWTACHGYNHPVIRAEVERQLAAMPHVMFAGMIHEPAARLASRLADLLPGDLARVFFSESGSVAVEVALKMATQYWLNRGMRKRRRFVTFKGGYHGDTFGTMAISDPEIGFHDAFKECLLDHYFARLPQDAESEAALVVLLERHGDDIAGIIVEPLIQGAGGMQFHAPETLHRLRALADRFDLLLIFDEIFTGFGRTGTLFASQGAAVTPDIITLSKALTGGTLPLAATVASAKVFDAFWSDEPGKALMHGPTYMANPLACAAANASLDLFASEPRLEAVATIERALRDELAPCRDCPHVVDVRATGAVGVVELSHIDDVGRLRSRFVQAGVFIRPFGRIVYITPAFTISPDDLSRLTGAIVTVLREGA